jgi:hypothetical protein
LAKNSNSDNHIYFCSKCRIFAGSVVLFVNGKQENGYMRQKYQMIRDNAGKILRIREYAIIDKNLKNVSTSNLREMDFFLLYEETYDSSMIESAIAGESDLIKTLRTVNFFPSANYAAELADAVIRLYDSPESADECQSELFFDDAPPKV